MPNFIARICGEKVGRHGESAKITYEKLTPGLPVAVAVGVHGLANDVGAEPLVGAAPPVFKTPKLILPFEYDLYEG